MALKFTSRQTGRRQQLHLPLAFAALLRRGTHCVANNYSHCSDCKTPTERRTVRQRMACSVARCTGLIYRAAAAQRDSDGGRGPNSIIEKKIDFFKTIIDFWKKTKLTSLVLSSHVFAGLPLLLQPTRLHCSGTTCRLVKNRLHLLTILATDQFPKTIATAYSTTYWPVS